MADEWRMTVDEWKARWEVLQQEITDRVQIPSAQLTCEDFDQFIQIHLLRRIENLEHELDEPRSRLS